MRLIRKEDVLELWEDTKIETYSFNDEIDFSELIKCLCKKDFSSYFEFKDELGDKNDAESVLVSVINELINDYNSKVDEYEQFLKSRETENNNNS